MTTTTERIAAAIKHILEEDRRADRERIAELERDAAGPYSIQRLHDLRFVVADLRDIGAKQTALIDNLNKQLDEAHKENARLVLERDLYTNCDERAPVVEEQGPWVVYDADELNDGQRVAGLRVVVDEEDWDWSSVASARGFQMKSTAEAVLREMGGIWPNRRVITLAEARAIEAKRG